MKNIFFELALGKAKQILGARARILLLLARLAAKLKNLNVKDIKSNEVKQRIFVFGRLLKAFVKGQYTSIPWKALLLITAAVIYFINPADLIPDWILAVGFTDDAGILMMVYSTVQVELNKFLDWEKMQLTYPASGNETN